MIEFSEDLEITKEIDDALDQFEQDLAGLPKWQKTEIPNYFYMDVTDLAKKTPEELSEAVFRLNQHALNVQRLINKLKAWDRWCVSKLDELEAKYIMDIPTTYGYNERPKLARNTPENCKKINRYLRKTRMEMDRIWGMPEAMRYMAQNINDLKFAALRREKQYESE